MKDPFRAAGIAGGALLAGAGAAAIGAFTLFNKVIPRQDGVKVDTSEMANEEQWEVYQKMIQSRKEWFLQQETEHVTIRSRDGLTLCGDYVHTPTELPENKLLIAFHGYTSSRMSCSSIAVSFLKRGYDVLIVDARAHGESEGEYSGFGVLDRFDCLEWIKYANNRFGSRDIILHGVSMGASTVLMASGLSEMPDNVKAVIADCGFTSPYDVFAHVLKRDYKLPPFPIMNITDEICRQKAGYGFSEYSTLTAMSRTAIPTLFIHGKNDRFVPVWMSEKNYEACAAPKDMLLVANAGHGASLFEAPELYINKVFQFLAKYAE